MKKLLLITAISFCLPSFGQNSKPFLDWETTSGTQNFFYKNVTEQVGRDTYVAGATLNGNGDYDLIISRIDQDGQVAWTQTYAGSGGGDDAASAITVDGNGNVYVTGSVYINSTNLNDIVLIKYNSSGTQLWVATFNGNHSGDDGGLALLEDGSRVFITGTGRNTGGSLDFLTVAYDTAGAFLWKSYYDYGGLDDAAHKILLDGNKLIVYGAAQTSFTEWDYALVTYNKSTGLQGTTTVNTGSGLSIDQVTDINRDNNGNIYIVGGTATLSTGFDYFVAKFDTALNQVWNASYNGTDSLHDLATSVKVDASGNVYVTGFSTTTAQDRNYLTIKYNSSGTQQWTASYNGNINSGDSAAAMVLDNSGNIYVTGMSYNGTSYDYVTVKYDASGNEMWEIAYNDWWNGHDNATNIALDTLGAIIVSGTSWNDTSYTYRTVKYTDEEIIIPPDTQDISPAFFLLANRGQLMDSDSVQRNDLKFYTLNTSPNTYFSDSAMSFVLSTLDTVGSTADTTYRVDMKFFRGNVTAAQGVDQTDILHHYILGYLPRPVEQGTSCERVRYAEVFDDVDLQVSSNSLGLKYYWIVKPGGSASSIELLFEGQSALSINSGDLVISTSIGNIILPEPIAYQIDANGDRVAVAWSPSYSISGSNVTLTTGTINSAEPLILEIAFPLSTPAPCPNCDWSTYLGGTSYDEITTVDTDWQGNIYVAGATLSTDFPSEIGQVLVGPFSGNYDAFAAKFRGLDKKLLWFTYFGGGTGNNGTQPYGPGYDFAHELAIGGTTSGDVAFVVGTTKSSNFPVYNSTTYSNAYQFQNTAGKVRSFIAGFFSITGTIYWSTTHGGSYSEDGLAISTSPAGIAIAGGISDYPAFPVPSNDWPYVTPSGGYSYEEGTGFFVYFGNDLSIKWASLTAGNGGQVRGCWLTGFTDVANPMLYLTGESGISSSFDYKVQTGSYNQSVVAGGEDAFISKFDVGNYTQEWATPFGGSATDVAYDIYAADNGDVTIVGETESTNFPTEDQYTPNGHNDDTHAGDKDIFIAKFTAGLNQNLFWSTYYGGSSDDEARALTYDVFGNLYIAGTTSSTSSLLLAPSQPTLYEQTVLGNNGGSANPDAFILSFDNWQVNKYSTYFGGGGWCIGNDIAIHADSKVYMVGRTASTNSSFPLQPVPLPGYNQEVLSGGNTAADGFIFSFGINNVFTPTPEIEESEISSSLFCYPNPASDNLTVKFRNLEQGKWTISIVNLIGQVVYDSEFLLPENGEMSLDVSNLSSGVYFLTFKGQKDSQTVKFVKE